MGMTISDVVNKYSAGSRPEYEDWVATSLRLRKKTKLELETLAEHFGVSKTSLLRDFIEGAVNEVWEQISDEMDDGLKGAHYLELQKMGGE